MLTKHFFVVLTGAITTGYKTIEVVVKVVTVVTGAGGERGGC